jgi:hypothetical protein
LEEKKDKAIIIKAMWPFPEPVAKGGFGGGSLNSES